MDNLNSAEKKLALLEYELARCKTEAERQAIFIRYGYSHYGKPPFKVFISSPGDVDALRAIADALFIEKNNRYSRNMKEQPFLPYFWENSMKPGYSKKIQADIFNEFGEWCDIFILLIWGSIGKGGTEEEYQKFENKFRVINPKCEFYVCKYNHPIEVDDINTEDINRMRAFYDLHKDNWKQLGRKRGVIKNLDDFKFALEEQLDNFLDNKIREGLI
jgi:hypothetical protein